MEEMTTLEETTSFIEPEHLQTAIISTVSLIASCPQDARRYDLLHKHLVNLLAIQANMFNLLTISLGEKDDE